MKTSPCPSAHSRRPSPLATSIAATIVTLLAAVSARANIITLNQSSSTNNGQWTLPVGTNLLSADVGATFTGAAPPARTTNPPVLGTTSTDWFTLSDGLLGTADNAGALLSVAPDNGTSVIFTLDTSVNVNGYSLTSFDGYAVWPDNGRRDQNYTIQYATVADPGNYFTLAVVNNSLPFTPAFPQSATHTQLTDTTGILTGVGGIGSLKFLFGTPVGQENGWVGLTEFIVLGTPSNAALSWTGVSGSGGNATWISGADSNWKQTLTNSVVSFDSTAPLNFDDTGTNTNITVQGAGITAATLSFANGTKTYTIGGGAITTPGGVFTTGAGPVVINSVVSGSGGATSSGTGTMTLAGANNYLGTTTVNSGTLSITNSANTTNGSIVLNGGILDLASLSDYGVASAMGLRQSTSDTGDDTNTATAGIGLQFRGGTLKYTGTTAQSTNRNIRVINTATAATIDASGANPNATLSFTHTGANTNLFENPGARTITLTGTNTGNNSFSIATSNQGASATNLTKTGTGTWLLTGPDANGTLSATSVTNGTLSLAKTNAMAVAGTLSIGSTTAGTLSVLKLDSTGTGGNQIADTVTPTFVGSAGAAILRMNNLNETIGGLTSSAGAGVVENESGVAGTATVTVNVPSGTKTFAGVLRNGDGVGIDGTLALTKIGAGIQTLTGASTYTGATTVAAGTLTVNGSLAAGTSVTIGSAALLNGSATSNIAGPVAVANNGTLGGLGTRASVTTVSGSIISPSSATAVGTLTIGTLSLASGSVLNYNLASTSSGDLVNVTTVGGLTINGGTFNLFTGTSSTLPQTTNGTYKLLTYTTSFGGALSNLSVGNPQVGKTYTIADTGSGVGLGIQLTMGSTAITEWNGATDLLWTAGTNWVGGTTPNATQAMANFGTIPTVPTSIAVNGTKTVGGITLNNTFGYTLTGAAGVDKISLNNGIAAAPIAVTLGNHVIAAPLEMIASGAFATTLTGTTLTISGNISGTKSFSTGGAGTTVFTGTNSYTATNVGGTNTLRIGDGNLTGTLGSGDVTVSTGATLAFHRSDDITVSNNLFGTGAIVTKFGANTLTLTGAGAYTGVTNIAGGTLRLGAGGSLPSAANFTITNNATLDLNGHTQSTGQGGLPALGNGIVGTIIGGALNIQTSNLYLQNGTFTADLTSTAGSTGRLWIGGDAAATVNLGGTNTVVFSDHASTIIGNATTGDAGTVKLLTPTALGPNTEQAQLFTGTLDLNGQSPAVGSLLIANGATSHVTNSDTGVTVTYAGAVVLTNAGSDLSSAGNITLSGVISGNAFDKSGAGLLTLSGANTFGGHVTINAGAVRITSNTGLGAGGFSGVTNTLINSGGALELQGGITVNEHFHFNGSGPAGEGGLRSVSGANTLTTNFAIDGDSVIGVDAGTLTVAAQIYHDNGIVALTKIGAGTLTLSNQVRVDTLTTSGGVTNIDGTLDSGLTLNTPLVFTSILNANATTNISVSQTLAELNIGDGAVVTLGSAPAFAQGLEAAPAIGAAAVPEPGSLGLLLAGALGFISRRPHKHFRHIKM